MKLVQREIRWSVNDATTRERRKLMQPALVLHQQDHFTDIILLFYRKSSDIRVPS
jgi:hypothetical protein